MYGTQQKGALCQSVSHSCSQRSPAGPDERRRDALLFHPPPPPSAAPYRWPSSWASTRCSFLCSRSATRCSLILLRSAGSLRMSCAVAVRTSQSVMRSMTPPCSALCSASAPPADMWCSSSLRRRPEMFWCRKKAGRMSRR